MPDPQFWNNRAVAVTGGTGFLGAHVVAALVQLGAEVVVVVRDEIPFTSRMGDWRDRVGLARGDVTVSDDVERILAEYEVQTVLHLAAQSQVGVANRTPGSTWDSNVRGTWTVLEESRKSPSVQQVVVASSDKAYGRQRSLPYTESSPLLGLHPYDASKACADIVARSYARSFQLPVAVTRCGNLFGPGDTNWERLVPGTIRSLFRGERPLIRSDGTMTRHYLYVTDAASAYLSLAEALAARPESVGGEAFNFAAGHPLSVLEVVDLVQQAAGTNLEPDILGAASNEIDHQALSCDKARRVLGWEPQFGLEEALATTVEWYRKFLDA